MKIRYALWSTPHLKNPTPSSISDALLKLEVYLRRDVGHIQLTYERIDLVIILLVLVR